MKEQRLGWSEIGKIAACKGEFSEAALRIGAAPYRERGSNIFSVAFFGVGYLLTMHFPSNTKKNGRQTQYLSDRSYGGR